MSAGRRPRRAWGGALPARPADDVVAGPGGHAAGEPLLPTVTSDEVDEGWGEDPGAESGNDERLRREVPPHW